MRAALADPAHARFAPQPLGNIGGCRMKPIAFDTVIAGVLSQAPAAYATIINLMMSLADPLFQRLRTSAHIMPARGHVQRSLRTRGRRARQRGSSDLVPSTEYLVRQPAPSRRHSPPLASKRTTGSG